jgi:hypothetical protein
MDTLTSRGLTVGNAEELKNTKITVSLGSQLITFWGDDLKINSFTREGAIVQGNITSMEFST